MVILGGLEFVVGGYLVHKHYKNKNEKKRLEEETQQRRHQTFPGAKPQSCPRPSPHHHQHRPPPNIPQQKYTYHAPQAQPPRHPYYQPQFQHDARPHPIHTQSFNIPRRPVPPPRHRPSPPQIIQPLQRADSCATISRMPIANGYRPSGMNHSAPAMPPRPLAPTLSPIPQSPYSNGAFSVSTPALALSPITPTTPLYGTGQHGGRQTIDDNWETYTAQGGRHYAPSESTALGEAYDPDEPPPPYRP
ncbi:hypothetical protein CC80DRAFT_453776 [Byssothecium circinans]|uniref:PAT1 multi-domain protein n=1 Tax=Byssothecium circinans TaxID=147558 RepID=A0A6A5TG26_9PLEO|nr:hypothetical protein CC80DRAFT_453776 [Byssothecium circinans]